MTPFTLTPSQPYTLSYYITDHTDPTTYFVQAVVYDSATGAVLDTQNLVQQATNSHLYTKVTQAPGDSSGHGRRIIVIATAYEDANHTVKSALYQQQPENYLVVKPGAGLALGGGGFDYRAIQDMFVFQSAAITDEFAAVRTFIETLAATLNVLLARETDLSPVLAALADLAARDIPQAPDFVPVMAALGALSDSVNAITIPEAVDTAPLQTAIDSLEKKMPTDTTGRHFQLMEAVGGIHDALKVITGIQQKSAALAPETPLLSRRVSIKSLISRPQ